MNDFQVNVYKLFQILLEGSQLKKSETEKYKKNSRCKSRINFMPFTMILSS